MEIPGSTRLDAEGVFSDSTIECSKQQGHTACQWVSANLEDTIIAVVFTLGEATVEVMHDQANNKATQVIVHVEMGSTMFSEQR